MTELSTENWVQPYQVFGGGI